MKTKIQFGWVLILVLLVGSIVAAFLTKFSEARSFESGRPMTSMPIGNEFSSAGLDPVDRRGYRELETDVLVEDVLPVNAEEDGIVPGSLFGTISSSDGSPLKKARIRFSLDANPESQGAVVCVSDEFGGYEIQALPPGHYFAFCYGSIQDEPEDVEELLSLGISRSDIYLLTLSEALLLGEVDVKTGIRLPFNMVLPGNRILTGSFIAPPQLMEGIELGCAVQLRLSLYRYRDRNRGKVVASGITQTFAVPDAPQGDSDPPRAGSVERLGENGPEPLLSNGRFLFRGLEPVSYVLRISLGDDEDGHDLHVEREVDLFGGNVALQTEELVLDEFFGEK